MGIILENVTYSYGDKNVLAGINLNVATGEYVGIIGASGGGKSTLLKLLSGLYKPQGGTILVDGVETPFKIQRKVAVVMQNTMLFPATIRENITCGHPMEEESIVSACKAAQLLDWISSLQDGLDTYVGERGGKVSGGQAQRIAIARAIAKDSPVILLDEATSALDKDTGKAVIRALSNLTKGKTVIHVTHSPEMLTDCNRVFLLKGGILNET